MLSRSNVSPITRLTAAGLILWTVFAAALPVSASAAAPQQTASPAAVGPTPPPVPMTFVPNVGQTGSAVAFNQGATVLVLHTRRRDVSA